MVNDENLFRFIDCGIPNFDIYSRIVDQGSSEEQAQSACQKFATVNVSLWVQWICLLIIIAIIIYKFVFID